MKKPEKEAYPGFVGTCDETRVLEVREGSASFAGLITPAAQPKMGANCATMTTTTVNHGDDVVTAALDDRRLLRLKYASVLRGQEKQAEGTLSAIMDCALQNNPKHDITGILYYSRSTQRLVQVLEGPACNVAYLFNMILADGTHRGCEVL